MIYGKVQFGKKSISYMIHFAERKSLGLQVHPDGSVHAIAPVDTSSAEIARKVLLKAGWILRQQDHFASFLPLTPPRQYIDGETHLYLGRQYRLRKMLGEAPYIKLYRGFIEVYTQTGSNDDAATALRDWYKIKAKEVFTELLSDATQRIPKFQDKSFSLHIKSMPTRWGSCSPAGRITLNTELVKAPKACIEYVIIHELCHLKYPSHNKQFYRLLSTLMPDWEKWKDRLEKFMA